MFFLFSIVVFILKINYDFFQLYPDFEVTLFKSLYSLVASFIMFSNFNFFKIIFIIFITHFDLFLRLDYDFALFHAFVFGVFYCLLRYLVYLHIFLYILIIPLILLFSQNKFPMGFDWFFSTAHILMQCIFLVFRMEMCAGIDFRLHFDKLLLILFSKSD